MTRLALAFATACGVGYVPLAPVTFGSAVGLLLWWALPASPYVRGAAIVMLFAVGSWSGRCTRRPTVRRGQADEPADVGKAAPGGHVETDAVAFGETHRRYDDQRRRGAVGDDVSYAPHPAHSGAAQLIENLVVADSLGLVGHCEKLLEF